MKQKQSTYKLRGSIKTFRKERPVEQAGLGQSGEEAVTGQAKGGWWEWTWYRKQWDNQTKKRVRFMLERPLAVFELDMGLREGKVGLNRSMNNYLFNIKQTFLKNLRTQPLTTQFTPLTLGHLLREIFPTVPHTLATHAHTCARTHLYTYHSYPKGLPSLIPYSALLSSETVTHYLIPYYIFLCAFASGLSVLSPTGL